MKRPLSGALLSLSLASSVQAQVFGPNDCLLDMPDTGDPSPFTRIQSGDLDGDLMQDCVLQKGPYLIIAWSVGAYEATYLIQETFHDFAVIGRDGEGIATLLVANDTGLEECVIDTQLAPSGEWITFEDVAAAGPDWDGLQLLRAVNLDGGAGALDLIGVESDGRSIHSLLVGAQGSYTAGSFDRQSVGLVSDVVGCDLGGDGVDDVAFVTSWGLEVYGTEGQPRFGIPHSVGAPGSIDVMRDAAGVDRVVWVRWKDASDQEVVLVAGPQSATAFDLYAGEDVVDVAVADHDGDGDDDLVCSVRSHPDLSVYKNTNDTFSATNVSLIAIPGGFDPSNNESDVASFEHDGDGDRDYAMGLSFGAGAGMAFVHKNTGVDHTLAYPTVVAGSEQYVLNIPDGTYSWRLTLDDPALQRPGMEEIEVIYWKNGPWDVPSPDPTTHASPAQAQYLPLGSGPHDLEFALYEGTQDKAWIHFVSFRCVRREVVGNDLVVVEKFPTMSHAFVSSVNRPGEDYLVELYGSIENTFPLEASGEGGEGGVPGEDGCSTPGPCLPDLPPNPPDNP